MSNKTDPMLQKMIPQSQRANELRLLKEWEAAGKIKRVDYVPPEVDEEDESVPFDDETGLDIPGEIPLPGGNVWKKAYARVS